MHRTIRFALWAACLPALAANQPAPETLMRAGHWKRLRALTEPKLKANPNDAEAAYWMSRVKTAYADLAGALPLAEQAVAAEPRNSQYRLQLGRVLGLQARRAGVFKAIGLARRFRREAERALALDPANVDARFALIEFHLSAPGILGGDKKRADALAEEIFEIHASRGWQARATVLGRRKKPDLAQLEAFYARAVEADPSFYNAHANLAAFLAADEVKRYELVETHAREAIKLDPGRAAAYTALVHARVKLQQLEDLDALLAEAESNVPDNLVPYFAAGRALVADNREPQRAERYLRRYLGQEPEGQSPSLAAALWRLGLALEKQGRKAEAIAEIEAAVRLEPSLDAARKDLKRLK